MMDAPGAGGLLSMAAAKAGEARAASSSSSTAPAPKPEKYPYQKQIVAFFATIVFLAWSKQHDAWPYADDNWLPALIFFGLGAAIVVVSYHEGLKAMCGDDDTKFPHKMKILCLFAVLLYLAWQHNHVDSEEDANARTSMDARL